MLFRFVLIAFEFEQECIATIVKAMNHFFDLSKNSLDLFIKTLE